MKILLISVFLISLVCFMSIPDVFGVVYPINVPMGSAAGIRDTGFSPDIIKIESGDMIKWAIFDRGIHSVTSDSGLFDSGSMEANKTGSTCFPNCKPFTYTFHNDGTYNYHCKFHSWMQGSVIVGGVGSTASAKDCTNVGCVYLDNKQYGVNEGRTVLVKIYGKVQDVSSNDFVYLTIKEPSGKLTEHKIPVTSTGKFEYPLPISYDKRGMYNVIVRGEYNPNGSKIGSVWFEVFKTSAMSQLKDITPTSIVLTTNSQSYIKGSTIGIAGQLVPYQSGSFEVTIKVNSPNGNVVNVAQIRPSSTGMFESTANTSNWTQYGNYEIKAQYENLIKSTSFAFTPGPSATSKTSTFLRLDPIAPTFKSLGPNLGADVELSGTLLTSDRNSVITGAKIKLIDTKFNKSVTVTTDREGKFNAIWNWAVGNNYGIYAVYDGSLNFGPSESKQELFQVTRSAIQPAPPIPSSSGFDPIVLVALVIVAVAIVAIIAVKRKKKPQTVQVPQQSKGHSGGSTAYRTFTCPDCQGGKIEQNLDGSEFCLDCGWES